MMKYSTETIVSPKGEKLFLTLPSWEPINTQTFVGELRALFEEKKALIGEVAKTKPLTFAGIDVTAEVDEKLGKLWGPLSHLNGTMQSKEIRKVFNRARKVSVRYSNDFSMRKGYYNALVHYRDKSAEYQTLDVERKKIIDDAIKDFELAGVGLPTKEKKRLKAINKELSELTECFQNNVKDAVAAWGKHVPDEALLAGVPDGTKEAMARAAKEKKLDGWYVTMHAPIYVSVITHATNRELRKELYIAYNTRASDQGPLAGKWNNMPLVAKILALRDEKAKLLGFRSYAEFALQKRMAPSVERVFEFLREIAAHAREKAQKEFAELELFARSELNIEELMPWDTNFVAERLNQKQFGFSEEELRQYFSEGRVYEGMWSFLKKLYGAEVRERKDVARWDPSVRFFEVYDSDGELRGGIYADLYARKSGKNGGAWMDVCVSRRKKPDGVELPVGHLVANFTPPPQGKETQFLHGEVETNFHELGHNLHLVFTRTDRPEVSMEGVEWDAVECPSQINENWCWNKEVLRALSGGKLPDELADKLIASKQFLGARAVLRQIEFSLMDMELHAHYDPKRSALDVLKDVRKETGLAPVYEHDRFPASFTHIFSGGYPAGYYSYLLAEVLSADGYAAYEEIGDIFDPATGVRFLKEVLEVGSSRPFMESFRAFRGREPKVDALLRHRGLLTK